MANDFFSGIYFGSALWQYALLFVTILSFLIIGKIINFILKNYVKKLTAKTKTEFDDLLIEAAQSPIMFLSILAGSYFGLGFLTVDDPLKLTISNIAALLLLINLAWFLLRIVDGLIIHFVVPLTMRTKSRMDGQLVPIISKTLKASIIAMAFIMILDNFGYDITAIIAGLGIGGLAIAFAAQQTIADAFGGLNIFMSKPFYVGDKIEVDGVIGTVEQIGIRHTHIRDLDGRINVISNSRISAAIVKNRTSEPGRKIRMNLEVTYDTSVKKIEQAISLIKEILSKQQNVDQSSIVVGFTEFKDSSLNIFAMFYIREIEYADIVKAQNTINLGIKEAFEKNEIEFAYPTHTVYLHNNSTAKPQSKIK